MLIVYKFLKLRINSACMTNKHDIIKGYYKILKNQGTLKEVLLKGQVQKGYKTSYVMDTELVQKIGKNNTTG